jgi:hypothetical protein
LGGCRYGGIGTENESFSGYRADKGGIELPKDVRHHDREAWSDVRSQENILGCTLSLLLKFVNLAHPFIFQTLNFDITVSFGILTHWWSIR